MLAATGIELAPLEELRSGDIYAARLEGVEHEFFAIKNGHPHREGGDVPINAVRYFLYEIAKLLTKVFASGKSPERVATLEEMGNSGISRLAFVLLDDDLSYLMQWSPLLQNCRPMRPDVW